MCYGISDWKIPTRTEHVYHKPQVIAYREVFHRLGLKKRGSFTYPKITKEETHSVIVPSKIWVHLHSHISMSTKAFGTVLPPTAPFFYL